MNRRAYWITELAKISDSFIDDTARMIEELQGEIHREGESSLLDHLRTCGAIPEEYAHDSSAEKLYSKYTDAVVSECLKAIGLESVVLNERADTADVQARADKFSLVADAKAFRLSRTAKNQKDFKIQAMDGWRNSLDFAVVVCPIYQLPTRTSQIYQQAIARNVCILSYSHLGALVGLSIRRGSSRAIQGFHEILKTVSLMNPSKNAVDYWTGINRTLVASLATDSELWKIEKMKSVESLKSAKKEAIHYLVLERNRLLGLSHDQALAELIRLAGVDSRIEKVRKIEHGTLLGVEDCE
ncbi:MAG: HindIII family type II restriction endonuclease [Pirellulaceae bacterium]|nr:HindIII family type II restriction endonuclease [Pirellulaceae bacterium]